MRRKARRDSNEHILVETARQLGASVFLLNDPYCGDALLGFRGKNYLIEFKGKYGKQRPGQIEFEQHWRGQYCVIRTEQELLDLLTNDSK